MTLKERLCEVQKELDGLPTLYLKRHKRPTSVGSWTLCDFILHLIVSLSEGFETMERGTGNRVCLRSKRRSIGDIYRLCRYYYNDVSLYEVQYCLSLLIKEEKINYFYCNHNKKRVYMEFSFYKTHDINPVEYSSPDEYGIEPQEITKLSKKKDIKDFNL